jgi:hypothetical protein
MSDLSRRATQMLDEARASRPALDRRRKERVRQAVASTVATTAVAAGAQAAQTVGATKSVATAWVTTTVGKVVLGVGAAVVGSGLTVGVMSARRAAVAVVRPAVEPAVGSRGGTFSAADEARPTNTAPRPVEAVRATDSQAAQVGITQEDHAAQPGPVTGRTTEDERAVDVHTAPPRVPRDALVAAADSATGGTPSDERAKNAATAGTPSDERAEKVNATGRTPSDERAAKLTATPSDERVANASTVTGQVPQAGRAVPSRLVVAEGSRTEATNPGRPTADVRVAPSRATTPAVEPPGERPSGERDGARRSDALATDQPGVAPVRGGTGNTGSPQDGSQEAAPGRQLDLPATPGRTGSTAVSTPPLFPTGDARDSSPRPERTSSSRATEARGREPAFDSTGGSGRPPPEPAAPLRDELTVLRLAKAQHDAGTFAAALASLDEYDTRFPAGVMAVESQVLRVLTLCELGRQPDARAVLVALHRKSSRSPAVTRLKTSCAAE